MSPVVEEPDGAAGPTVPSDAAPRARSWGAVAAAVDTCVVCAELAATRRRTVPGSLGSVARSGLMLVGEAPGAQEDESGQPFVGRSGALLDSLLAELGVSRAQVTVANVLKCRPPENRPPLRGEINACRPWLERQLQLAAPAVVVALGSTAVTWFFGPAARIGTLRGTPFDRDHYRVLATYHPSAALRFGPRGKPIAALREDLAHALSLLPTPLPQERPVPANRPRL